MPASRNRWRITSPQRTGEIFFPTALGFHYVAASRSLTGLLLLYFALNLLMSLTGAVLSPMILARTENNELILGTVQMLFGISGIVGAALVSIWGGPKRKMLALFIAIIVTSLFGSIVLGIGRNLLVWGSAHSSPPCSCRWQMGRATRSGN